MKPIFILVFLCGTLCSFAQTTPEPTLEELSIKVEQLEQKTSTWEKIAARLPDISGYAQVGYEYNGDASTFLVKRVRLSLAGDLGTKFDYKVQIEFASPKLVDVYVRYRPFNALNVQVGEFKVPFSIDNTDYTPVKLELIDYPLAIKHLVGFDDVCGLSATGRDLGAMVYGGFFRREGYSILNYDFGVFNGEGINLKDANRSKDIVARLTIKPVAGLMVSGSYYWGETGADYRKRVRYGVGACYDRGRGVVRGEYICGTTGLAQNDGPLFDLDSEGWYVMGGWRATHNLMPAVRYDTFTMDTAQASESRQTNYTAGLTWQPVKYLRCQLNYTYEHYTSASAADRNVVAVMLTGMF